MKRMALTAAIALAGVGLFHVISMPLPWLLGPIFACLAAAIAGVQMHGDKRVSDAMRTILGVAVGATLTPTVLASFPAMWPTLLMVPVTVLAIAVLGIPYFLKVWRYDFATAYYASMPGGLQDMIAFGEEAGGKVRSLSLIHATRVMVIVVALPFILEGFWSADLSSPPGVPLSTVPMYETLLMIACAAIGWQGARRVGMFGAAILGPLIVTAIVTLAGLLENRPPAEAIWAAQFFIGMGIGSQYTGITVAELRRDIAASAGFCLLLIVLTLVVVEVIYVAELAPGMETLLAFAPGGQAELTVLALIVGADVAFVVAHHVLRLFVVILGAPIAMRVFTPAPSQ
ncbi:MAG: AbrB family transcriptional regulator [Pseudomonadota bacterium]